MSKPLILLAESDEQIFQAIKITLQNIGFLEIRRADSIDQARSILGSEPVDLFISEARLKDGTTSFLIRQLRAGDLGGDPFLPVISMVANSSPDLIKGLVNDGPDDLIVKPFSAKVLSDRIDRIVNARKPFVVTYDYLGPDRRSAPRADEEKEARSFTVPNTLKQKIEGKPSRKEFSEGMKKTVLEITEARIEAQAGAIVYQLERLLPKLAEGLMNDLEKGALAEVITLSDRVHASLPGTSHAAQDVLFNTVSGLATTLKSGEKTGLHDNIGQIQKLSHIIKRDFKL